MKLGDRVKLVGGGAYAGTDGLTGVLVRKTRGYWGNVVWLDKPHRYIEHRRGSRVRQTAYVLYMPERRLEPTDDGPRYVTRPAFKVLVKNLYQTMHRGKVEVIDRETGEVLKTAPGVAAASSMAERLTLRLKMEERKASRA